jgi:predicted amidohydrolase
MAPRLADFEANIQKIKKYFKAVMEKYPATDLIVFPELITSGYECTNEEFETLAETIPGGQSLAEISALCRYYGVNAVYGLPERAAAALYNSAVFIGSRGQLLHTYRKAHPFDTERNWCKAGGDLAVFDTDFGKAAVMICYDAAFPELARVYALQGAELLIIVTNWEKPYSEDWDLVTRARAYDNILHVVSANRIGVDKTMGFFGHSKIVDPLGRVITSLDEEVEGIISASIDLSLTKKLREDYYTFLEDRRPELYTELVKPKTFA